MKTVSFWCLIIFSLCLFVSCGASKMISSDDDDLSYVSFCLEESKNDFVILSVPFQNHQDTIFLDSIGCGKIKMSVQNPTFAYLTIPKLNNSIKILLNSNFKLELSLINDSITFFGPGSEQNNFLQRVLQHEIYISKSFAEFKNVHNDVEPEIYFLERKNILDSINKVFLEGEFALNKRYVETRLILSEFDAFNCHLLLREILLYYSENLGATPRKLFQTIGLNDLLKDSVLIESSSHNLIGLLMIYNDFLINEKLNDVLDISSIWMVMSEQITQRKDISTQNIEFLVYLNILESLYAYGATPKLFEILDFYKRSFKNSHYENRLYLIIEKFVNLNSGQPAFNFTFSSVNGLSFELQDFIGNYIFIDIWASWCGPCIQNLPKIENLVQSYPEIVFLFLNVEDVDQWLNYLKNEDNKHIDNHYNIYSSDFKVKYKLTSLPRYILIDKEGNIVNAFYWFSDVESLELHLNNYNQR